MVQLFLRAGLDPSREHDGKTPLTMALRGGHTETAKLLLDFKANHGPAAAGYIEIRSLILQRRKAREAQREHLHETFDIGNGTLTTPSST
jgi:ankyrin repeat protein